VPTLNENPVCVSPSCSASVTATHQQPVPRSSALTPDVDEIATRPTTSPYWIASVFVTLGSVEVASRSMPSAIGTFSFVDIAASDSE
jgi:hypothetical protein